MLGYAGATVLAFGVVRLGAHPDAWALVPIVVGAMASWWGFARARARRTWLGAVGRGEVPGLTIELCEGDADPHLPCLLGRADRATAMVVREPDENTHYRAAQRERAIAVIDPWTP
ncbi:MAG: hypothetical protein JNK04_06000 [Myxococcales bacterium]|nr:hypothetical protein [Myxococcales bacterium]